MSIQNYLIDTKFTLNEKQLLFKLRTKIIDVNMFSSLNLECNICEECEIQTQQHLLICPKIISNCQDLYDNISIEHDDIYGNIEQQLAVTRLYQQILDSMEIICSV